MKLPRGGFQPGDSLSVAFQDVERGFARLRVREIRGEVSAQRAIGHDQRIIDRVAQRDDRSSQLFEIAGRVPARPGGRIAEQMRQRDGVWRLPGRLQLGDGLKYQLMAPPNATMTAMVSKCFAVSNRTAPSKACSAGTFATGSVGWSSRSFVISGGQNLLDFFVAIPIII